MHLGYHWLKLLVYTVKQVRLMGGGGGGGSIRTEPSRQLLDDCTHKKTKGKI